MKFFNDHFRNLNDDDNNYNSEIDQLILKVNLIMEININGMENIKELYNTFT